jgi:hypothetical protein
MYFIVVCSIRRQCETVIWTVILSAASCVLEQVCQASHAVDEVVCGLVLAVASDDNVPDQGLIGEVDDHIESAGSDVPTWTRAGVEDSRCWWQGTYAMVCMS